MNATAFASGRVLTIALIGAGVMLVWYTMSLLVSSIVESSVLQRWERRRMDQRIRRMDGHIIVCGYGRVGREAVGELQRDGKSVVVVEVRVRPSSPRLSTEGDSRGARRCNGR